MSPAKPTVDSSLPISEPSYSQLEPTHSKLGYEEVFAFIAVFLILSVALVWKLLFSSPSPPPSTQVTYGGLPVKKGYHRHHIIPLHAGGSDTADNIVYLTPKQHEEAHWRRYEETGDKYDLTAAMHLSGKISDEDAKKYAYHEGRRRSRWWRKN